MTRPAPMTPEELRQARELLRLSPTDLAAEYDMDPAIVDALEAGAVRIPARIADRIRWRVAVEERERALAAAGHGPCPTVVSLAEPLHTPGGNVRSALRSIEEHATVCPQCQARDRFAQSLPELPPQPMSALGRSLNAVAVFADRFPPWARPAVWIALLIAVIVVLRAVVAIAREMTR